MSVLVEVGMFGPLRTKFKWKMLVFHFVVFTSFIIAVTCRAKEILLHFIEKKVEAQKGHIM